MNRYTFILFLFCIACAQPKATENSAPSNKESDAPVEAVIPSAKAAPATGQEAIAEEQGSGPVVYITSEGDKYHTADCRYSTTAHTTLLSKAKADGKTACGICKPNSTTGEKQIRCAGTTAEGKGCQRMTSDVSGKCFQHR